MPGWVAGEGRVVGDRGIHLAGLGDLQREASAHREPDDARPRRTLGASRADLSDDGGSRIGAGELVEQDVGLMLVVGRDPVVEVGHDHAESGPVRQRLGERCQPRQPAVRVMDDHDVGCTRFPEPERGAGRGDRDELGHRSPPFRTPGDGSG